MKKSTGKSKRPEVDQYMIALKLTLEIQKYEEHLQIKFPDNYEAKLTEYKEIVLKASKDCGDEPVETALKMIDQLNQDDDITPQDRYAITGFISILIAKGLLNTNLK